MLTRHLTRRFAVSAEVKSKVFAAVNAYKSERSREILGDLQAKGSAATAEETKAQNAIVSLLSQEVTDKSLWRDFGFDGLDEVECMLTIEDALGLSVPDEEFHGVHGIEAALRVVEKYAPKEAIVGK